ncbi:hypothetical protein NUU61_005211 [Penicillium alfredii]|uniref:Major facilitator superfamily (MFS) profile domain-containing protein n=1 Tax=Penicillium alfredii TaxID=1506179 RepID=A0A9W9F8Z0_9EURO|nr:uncharacterized protein NUU61_005211 [Penicillium alfredii]KAJ5095855.1 hypothetical protein NUU61_005211 [Penicillium alfredii]
MAPENNPSETSPLLASHDAAAATGTIPSHYGEAGETQLPEPTKESAPSFQKQLKFIIPAVSLGVFLSAADQTIIMASYGQIGSDLKALNLTSWIATSYFLTLTSFQPLYGKLSDIFGRKACLLFAYAIFGTGCLFCGLAQNINQLIAARVRHSSNPTAIDVLRADTFPGQVFQGIGGGGMTTVVSILMSDIVPLRDRGLWQGVINIIYATGSGTGAPLGGILADYIGWRWAFLVQFPLCIIAFIAVCVLLKLPAREDSHWKTKLRRIDFLGAIVLVGAVLGFLLASLSVSVVLFVLFILVEIYIATEPFAPGHIIFDRTFFACYACNFFSFGGWIAALFYIPLYFQAVLGDSATVAGVRLLPSILSGVSGSLLSGAVMRWSGRYFWLTIAGYSFLTGGCLVLFLFSGPVMTSTIPMILGLAIGSFGNGIGVTTTLIGLISNATPDDQAVVTACSYLFRSLGSVIGLSLTSTVVQQFLRQRLKIGLRDSKNIDEIANRVRESLDFIKTLEPAVAKIVRGCYGWSTNKGIALMLVIVFFALFSSCFIRETKLSR